CPRVISTVRSSLSSSRMAWRTRSAWPPWVKAATAPPLDWVSARIPLDSDTGRQSRTSNHATRLLSFTRSSTRGHRATTLSSGTSLLGTESPAGAATGAGGGCVDGDGGGPGGRRPPVGGAFGAAGFSGGVRGAAAG